MTPVVTGQETREAIVRFNDAVERKDVESLRAAITQDCVFDSPASPSGKRYVGNATVEVFKSSLRSKVKGRSSWRKSSPRAIGPSSAGSTPGTTPTGAGLVRGIDLFRLRHGKVAEKLSYVKG